MQVQNDTKSTVTEKNWTYNAVGNVEKITMIYKTKVNIFDVVTFKW